MSPRPTPSYRRTAKRSLHLSAVAAAWLVVTGCLTTITPVPPGSVIHLASGEGILVVETQSNSDIENFRIVPRPSGAPRELSNLPEGHQIHLVVLPEGEYRWSRIELPGFVYRNRSYPFRWELIPDERWHVSVVAGRINYPGMIALRRSFREYLSYRVINRSGRLVELIEAQFPGLLRRFEPRYAGTERDDFLTHYRETLLSRTPPEAIPEEEATVAPGTP